MHSDLILNCGSIFPLIDTPVGWFFFVYIIVRLNAQLNLFHCGYYMQACYVNALLWLTNKSLVEILFKNSPIFEKKTNCWKDPVCDEVLSVTFAQKKLQIQMYIMHRNDQCKMWRDLHTSEVWSVEQLRDTRSIVGDHVHCTLLDEEHLSANRPLHYDVIPRLIHLKHPHTHVRVNVSIT